MAGQLVILNKSITEKEISFIDYIIGGYSISVAFSIDFTFSNGEVNKEDSLHHICANSPS